MMRTFFSLCAIFVCSAVFSADPFIKKADIPYVPGGGERQQLDLYLPIDYEKSTKPFPVICFIHGGAWQGGTKDLARTAANEFVQKGYAVAGITYRFCPQDPMPAQVIDCKAAVRWLKAHAKEYNLNANRFGVWGTSAGGHLSAFIGTGGAKEFDQGENLNQTSTVQAAVVYYGPTDFFGWFDADPNAVERFAYLFGGAAEEKKELIRSMSPVTHATRTSCPMLLVHAVDDATVPIAQSRKLHTVLRISGVEAELVEFTEGGHNFRNLLTPEVLEKIASLFEKHLK